MRWTTLNDKISNKKIDNFFKYIAIGIDRQIYSKYQFSNWSGSE